MYTRQLSFLKYYIAGRLGYHRRLVTDPELVADEALHEPFSSGTMYIYIYIYIERERDTYIHMCVYMYI